MTINSNGCYSKITRGLSVMLFTWTTPWFCPNYEDMAMKLRWKKIDMQINLSWSYELMFKKGRWNIMEINLLNWANNIDFWCGGGGRRNSILAVLKEEKWMLESIDPLGFDLSLILLLFLNFKIMFLLI